MSLQEVNVGFRNTVLIIFFTTLIFSGQAVLAQQPKKLYSKRAKDLVTYLKTQSLTEKKIKDRLRQMYDFAKSKEAEINAKDLKPLHTPIRDPSMGKYMSNLMFWAGVASAFEKLDLPNWDLSYSCQGRLNYLVLFDPRSNVERLQDYPWESGRAYKWAKEVYYVWEALCEAMKPLKSKGSGALQNSNSTSKSPASAKAFQILSPPDATIKKRNMGEPKNKKRK